MYGLGATVSVGAPTESVNWTQDGPVQVLVQSGADLQKIFCGTDGTCKLLYDRTLTKDKKAWLVTFDWAQDNQVFTKDEFGANHDVPMIISDNKPSLDFNKVVFVPRSDFTFNIPEDPGQAAFDQAKADKKEADAVYKAMKKISDKNFVVTGNDVALREAPSKKAKKVGTLNKGDALKIMGFEDKPGIDYVNVVYTSKGKTKNGYIATSYIFEENSSQAVAAVAAAKSAKKTTLVAPKKSEMSAKDLEPTPPDDTMQTVLVVGGAVAAAGLIFWLLKKNKII